MIQKKRVINYILFVVCCLCVFFGSGMKSRAVPQEKFVYRTIDEYHEGGLNAALTFTTEDSLSYSSDNMTEIKSFVFHVNGGNDYYAWIYSEEKYEVTYCVYKYKYYPDGTLRSVEYDQTLSVAGNPITLSDGSIIYTYGNCFPVSKGFNNSYEKSEILFYSNLYNVSEFSNNGISALNEVLVSRIKPEIEIEVPEPEEPEFVPDFDNYYHEDTDRWLNDLRASVEDGTLYATWDGLAGEGLHVLEGYQNMYVQFHLQFIDDKGTSSIADDEYTTLYDFYTELELNEFSVELSDFDVPEGYRLWVMYAEPYWYFNDDVNSTMFKGKLSYLFFDENGVSDKPLIKDTGDIYNPLDPNLSNWNAITNFTGDYFYNMGNVMNQTFNNWDSSGMNASNDKLNNSLQGFSQQEDVIFNQVSNNLSGFEFDNYLSFGDKVTNGISFGAGLINKFFEVSDDLTILFVVGCVMVFVFIVVGIWRFSK